MGNASPGWPCSLLPGRSASGCSQVQRQCKVARRSQAIGCSSVALIMSLGEAAVGAAERQRCVQQMYLPDTASTHG